MRKFQICLSGIILFFFFMFRLPVLAADTVDVNVVLQALEEEMNRSKSDLRLDVFDPPYFLSYQVKDYHKLEIKATFGAILTSNSNHFRNIYIETRVGNFDSDSSSTDLGFSRSTNYFHLPIENDLAALKREIWLNTDKTYKAAVSNYLQKKGKNIQKVVLEKIKDFSQGEINVSIDPLEETYEFTNYIPAWEKIIKKTSALFKKHPEIILSRVDFSAQRTVRIYLNSEGTKIVDQNPMFGVTISARTKSKDGMTLFDHDAIYFKEPDSFPSEELLKEKVLSLVKSLKELRKSEIIEPYAGPAIFEPDAAGVLFHEAIGHRLEGERQRTEREGKTFTEKIDKLILPDFINITDDPLQKKFNGTDLFGSYLYDSEGQIGQQVTLVKNGILKNFLLSRTPIKNFPRSNGHGRSDGVRDPMARMGNLIVKSNYEVSRAKLKEMLIEETKKQNKPYGLIIKKVLGGETNTSRYNFQVFKGTPVYIYKVYVEDGREELVRGAEFVGTPLTSINKIKATGSDYEVFNGFCGAESGFVPVSSVAPSIFLSEIELQRTASQKSRPPILSPPDLKK